MNMRLRFIPLTLLAAALAGCHNAPSATQTQTAAQQLAARAPKTAARPTVPAPPFKLFHQTDNSLTLVTADNATDDQVAAILFELHDAAQSHTFAKLGLPQDFIDRRDPMIWIHVYRGQKCASEKYATTKLPCGPSYHAAGDYTLGSFTDKNHDTATLLHDENHETVLF